jgi:hypothetical protein
MYSPRVSEAVKLWLAIALGMAATAALARGICYAFVAYGILVFALGAGSPSSSDAQSQDLTASAMRLPGGRLIVSVIGLARIGGGACLAYSALKKKFRERLELGRVRPQTRRAVEVLGQFGGIARGSVFATARIFLVIAAARFQPQQANGVDSSLRHSRARHYAHGSLSSWRSD